MKNPLSRKTWIALGLLGLCAGVITLQRVHTYREPLDRDITLYAVVAHELLHGRSLYSDLWDNKPPLVFLTYAAAEKIAGYGPPSIFLLNIVTALFSMVGLFWVGWIAGGTRIGLCAALFWALAGADLNLEANQPNTEVFVNCALIYWFGAFLAMRDSGIRRWRGWVLGLIAAIGSLYKPVMIFPVLLVLLAEALIYRKDKVELGKLLEECLQMALTGSAIWGMVLGYFYLTGRQQDFLQAVFVFNRFFAAQKGSLLANLFVSPPTLARLWGFGVFWPMIPLTIFAVCGLIVTGDSASRRRWHIWLAYLAGSYVAVSAPGYFLPHYFQLLLPPLIIGAAWSIATIQEWLERKGLRLSVSRWWFLAGCLIFIEAPFYRLSAEEWSRRKFNGGEFIVTQRVAERINQTLGPTEQFYNWGWETGLYFYSQKRPPAGVLFFNVLQGGPLAERLTQKTLLQLKQNPPKLIVFLKWIDPADLQRHPIPRWFGENYRMLPTLREQEPFLFMVRREEKRRG